MVTQAPDEGLDQGRDYTLVRVVEGGPRETGMMTLKRERLWNYLPRPAGS